TSTMDHARWIWPPIPVIGNFALTTYLFFLSQAVTQSRFLNFGGLLSRFLVLTAMALTLTRLSSLLFALIAHRPALFLFTSFMISLLILTLMDPLLATLS